MKITLSLLFLFILVSCGLKYTPQVTPSASQTERRMVIEKTIEDDFKPLGKTYSPIGYAPTIKIKPLSYQKLDSLFSVKYQLEQEGKKDPELEQQIAVQKIICENDTNEVIYLERHVFTLTRDSISEILSGNFYLNNQNELKNVEFTQSYRVKKDYISYYTLYAFEQPFLGGNYLTNDEAGFYKMYKAELERRVDKDAFMQLTLELMQIAHYKQSLNTETLIKELTRKSVHDNSSNYGDENFIKMEQITDNGVLSKYVVVYQSSEKTMNGTFLHRYQLEFDPYLMLMDKQEIPIQ